MESQEFAPLLQKAPHARLRWLHQSDVSQIWLMGFFFSPPFIP